MPDKRSISADDEEEHIHNGTPYAGRDQNSSTAIARDKLSKRAVIFDTIVTILVGPAEKCYSLHKGLLCKHSSYFHAALTGSFAEAATQTVRLDEEDPSIFDLFVAWLYTQRIIPEDMASKDVGWKILAEQYVFGDRRSSPSFKNAIIDALATKALDKEQFLPEYGTIKWIWDNTGSKASLRRFMVDYFAHVADLDEAFRTQRDRKRPPLDFVCDVLGRYYRLTNRMCTLNGEFEKPDIGKNYHDKVD